VTFQVDESPCAADFTLPSKVVVPSHCHLLAFISDHSQIMDARLGDKATWTGTGTQIPYTCQKNPTKVSVIASSEEDSCLLLRVITRVCRNSGVESSLDAITACNNYAVPPGFDELVVEDNIPLRMHGLAVAMCHECSTGNTVTTLHRRKFLECPRKLDGN
jgi:hypothetical protein